MSKSQYVDDEAVNRISRVNSTLHHDSTEFRKYSISVWDALARALDIDPTQEKLPLEGVVTKECIDNILYSAEVDEELHGEYLWFICECKGVFCCNCGQITIYDLNDCPRGEALELPFCPPHCDC